MYDTKKKLIQIFFFFEFKRVRFPSTDKRIFIKKRRREREKRKDKKGKYCQKKE
jgi:hypothetical protein